MRLTDAERELQMNSETTLLDIQESTDGDVAKALALIDAAMLEIDAIAEAVLESEHPSDGGDPVRYIEFGIEKERRRASRFFERYEDLGEVWYPNLVETFAATDSVFDMESSKHFVERCLIRVKSNVESYYPHLFGGKPARWQRGEMLLAAQAMICSFALVGIIYSPCSPKRIARCLFDARICFETAAAKLAAASYDEEVKTFQMRMMDSQCAAMDGQEDLLRMQVDAAKRQADIACESALQSAEMLRQSTAMTDMTKIIKWCTIATLVISACTLLVTVATAAASNLDFFRTVFLTFMRFVFLAI